VAAVRARPGRALVDQFHVEGEGFYDGEPGHLPLRARDLYDGAVPSATAAACELLARLAGTYERGEWADIVQASIERQGALLEAAPAAVPSMLLVPLLSEHGAELLLPSGTSPLAAVRSDFAPLATFVSTRGRRRSARGWTRCERAYLCQHGACQLPAETPAQLRGQLARLHSLQPWERPPGPQQGGCLMKGVAQILSEKPSKTVHAIGPNDTVYDAVRKMAEHGIGGLLVMEGEKILGIVTERDYARKIALAGRSSKETPVSVIMTTQVLCVGSAADDRRVHGDHDREPRAPPAGAGQGQADRPGIDR